MANEEHLKILRSGVEKWNEWSEEKQVFADLELAKLNRANLKGASFMGANFLGASLRHANLRGASLYRCNLREADVTKANLAETDLWGADLTSAIFGGRKSDHSHFALLVIKRVAERSKGTSHCDTSRAVSNWD
jgi:hypothetical protein